MSTNQEKKQRLLDLQAKLARLNNSNNQPDPVQEEEEIMMKSIQNEIVPIPATNGTHVQSLPMTKIKPDVEKALKAADKINQIGASAKSVFIERDEAIDALCVSLACGEHMIMLAKPGTSKSAIVHYFAKAMALNYFWVTLNPDTVKEDLLGPISMKALDQDIWTRKWAGLATAHIALTDEIGKASNQVLNLLIPVLEERKLVTPGGDKYLPIHTVIGASNETLDGDAEAVWDRYTMRVVLEPISSASNFEKLLSTDITNPPSIPVFEEELIILRATCDMLALNLSLDVKKKAVQIWSEIGSVKLADSHISDRRWKRWMRCAAGHALVRGSGVVEVEDLIVGKWMLWNHIKTERAKISKWLEEKVNEGLVKLRDAQALMEDLRKQFNNVNANDMEQVGKLTYNITRLLKVISQDGDLRMTEWKKMKDEVIAMRDDVFQG